MVKRISIDMPEKLADEIQELSGYGNRTKWIIEACKAAVEQGLKFKMVRE